MKIILLNSSIVLCYLFVSFTSALAQGTAFTYQGRLDDGNGPANGIYDLRFAVYDANTNGNQTGAALTNSAVGATNGLFVSVLDFGNGIFTGTNQWLEIAVRTNGGFFTALVPRQLLTPTPYAIFAGTAGTALAVNTTNINDASVTLPKLAPELAALIGAGKITSILNYGTNTSSGTNVNENNLKICYGQATMAGTSVQTITGLPFTSADTYTVIAIRNGTPGYASQAVCAAKIDGTRFALKDFTTDSPINWMAIGY